MPYGQDVLFGITSKAVVKEVPREHGALLGTTSDVHAEEGEVFPSLAGEAAVVRKAGGRHGSLPSHPKAHNKSSLSYRGG